MKKMLTLLFIGSLIFCLCGSALAANTRKGKKIYNKVCRSCHIRNADGGRIAPSNKTMARWKVFIDANKHKAHPDIIDGMSPKDRDNLIKFLQDFAADADAVETCG